MTSYRRLLVSAFASLAHRRYLVGVMLAWVLVVYLASGPGPALLAGAPSAPSARSSAPVPAGSPPAVAGGRAPAAGPSAALGGYPGSSAASVAALLTPDTSGDSSPPAAPAFQPEPTPTFSAPPPPPATPQPSCPYPVPQAASSPVSAGILLSFLGPLVNLSGPWASYLLPSFGALSPLVPFAAPTLSIAQPALNALTPSLSSVVADLVSLEAQAGLADNQQEAQFAQQFLPTWLKLINTLTPYEAELAATQGAQCLELFENELATITAKLAPQVPVLPPLPAPPSGSSDARPVSNRRAPGL